MSRRRNPFRGFTDTISEMNRTRQHWMAGVEGGQQGQPRTHADAWVPATDVFASAGDLVIRVELAGVRTEDVEITLSGGMLTISGERTPGPEEGQADYYVRERSHGAFRRSMTLPEGVDETRISATSRDGMLEIVVKGGTGAPGPQRIEISRAGATPPG
ncbi:MAG: Hsp20/alpha crystallin family protein [Actinomycetota bacterium]|nr:Hsp20/alpha crystallin family protein [Actinomycetota bacterium]